MKVIYPNLDDWFRCEMWEGEWVDWGMEVRVRSREEGSECREWIKGLP
jgi:hypothetical protein